MRMLWCVGTALLSMYGGPCRADSAPIDLRINAASEYHFDPSAQPQEPATSAPALTIDTATENHAQFDAEGSRYWSITLGGAYDFEVSKAGIISLGMEYFISN